MTRDLGLRSEDVIAARRAAEGSPRVGTLELLPAAKLWDVVRGRAPLVGTRLDPSADSGFVSPVEASALMGIEYGDLAQAEREYLSDPARNARRDAAVVGRVLIARLLTPDRNAPAPPRVRIVSARVHNMTIGEALEAIFEPPASGNPRMVHFVHAHALNLAKIDAELADHFARADLVFPDGIGVRLGARILGVRLRHNVNGTDLSPLLLAIAAKRGIPVALVGARPDVIEECASSLETRFPGLGIPIRSHGYVSDGEAQALASRLRDLGRSLIFVGMGTPRQEHWAWRYLASLPEATVITVGGLFDFFSNRIARAPLTWRELGVEWLWRMLQEPRRLTARYLVGNPAFLTLTLLQRLTARKADSRDGQTPDFR